MIKIQERILNSYSVNGTALKTTIFYNTYRKTYRFLKKSQWKSKEEIEEYQLQELNKLLHHAYQNVSYYTNLFDNIGLKPKDIKSINDLQKLPFLTKEMINNNIEVLRAKNFPENRFEHSKTGGSTGYPLEFYKERGVWLARLMAYNKILMNWMDCTLWDKYVFVTGRDEQYKYQLFGRVLVLSSFHMNEKSMPDFISMIKKLKPKYFMGYPSAITILAQYMKKNNIGKFPSVKFIACFAETLYEWQRKLLEETFDCRIHEHYGLREQTAMGGTCECSNHFHMFPEYGIIELIDKDGKKITKEDEIGEIVSTGFHTYIFPFIRYKTGDLGIYTNKKCNCGRNYPLLKKIEGRVQDFVISKKKQLTPFMRIQHLIAESSQNVKAGQFYQDKEGELILKIVKMENYTEEDSKLIQKNFYKYLGNDFDLSIEFVDDIPLTKRGKYQFLIQKLPIGF